MKLLASLLCLTTSLLVGCSDASDGPHPTADEASEEGALARTQQRRLDELLDMSKVRVAERYVGHIGRPRGLLFSKASELKALGGMKLKKIPEPTPRGCAALGSTLTFLDSDGVAMAVLKLHCGQASFQLGGSPSQPVELTLSGAAATLLEDKAMTAGDALYDIDEVSVARPAGPAVKLTGAAAKAVVDAVDSSKALSPAPSACAHAQSTSVFFMRRGALALQATACANANGQVYVPSLTSPEQHLAEGSVPIDVSAIHARLP